MGGWLRPEAEFAWGSRELKGVVFNTGGCEVIRECMVAENYFALMIDKMIW